MLSSLGHVRFVRALQSLEAEGVLDRAILISAASLRLLGIRVYTFFIDLLVQRSYYRQKSEELRFDPRYDLEPIPLKIEGFSTRLGTVRGELCSFRHLVEPFNVYEEVEFELGEQVKMVKIRPHNYVRKDCDAAIERLLQVSNERYWQDLYSYHKQIEAIDLGMSTEQLKFGPPKLLKLEE